MGQPAIAAFDAFRAEIRGLLESVTNLTKKTVRDDEFRERFRNLFRSWIAVVEPQIREHLQNKRELLKLAAELEAVAKLTSRCSKVTEYKKRLRRAQQFLDLLVIHLPPYSTSLALVPTGHRDELFTPLIPDLPMTIVPNAVFGWRSRLHTFVIEYPFDRSVFIMIRYRKRNNAMIRAIKESLKGRGLTGILASEHNLTDDLYNPVACLLCCSKGIAVFDRPERDQAFNPNVAYELGMLHLLGRPCLILKHDCLKTLQSDILMKLYTPYSAPRDVSGIVQAWAQENV